VRADECLVEAPQARAILNDVARVGERLGIRAYQEDRGHGMLRHAVVRVGWKTEEVLLTVVTNGQQLPREREFVDALTKAHPEITTIVQNINQRQTNAILGRKSRVLFGPGMIRDELLGCMFEIGPTTFYQTNPEQTEVLYRLAIEGAALEDGSRVLDAYCGCGTIGICAASAAHAAGLDVSVTGVEQVESAAKAARRNARANGLADACRFVAGDATEYMARLAGSSGGSGSNRGAGRSPARDGSQFDVVIMDPPRAGSTPEFLAGVLALAPRRVVYVSCNAVTQARDLKQLRAGGYRLERLTPVDMFPHTKHVETVAVLSRADG
jgi:23S rRNA (uracil-5-)-methyltransferase RumA